MNELVKKVWIVNHYEEKELKFNGYVFEPAGCLMLPNGMLYDLRTQPEELEPVRKNDIVVESLEEVFKRFPEIVTWDYLNNLEYPE